jgi:hypothetical protein
MFQKTIGPIFEGQEACSETSVKDYHPTLRNVSEVRRSHQHRGGSLKSRVLQHLPEITKKNKIVFGYTNGGLKIKNIWLAQKVTFQCLISMQQIKHFSGDLKCFG